MYVDCHELWCTSQFDDQDSGKGWCVEEMELAQRWAVGFIHLLYWTLVKVWPWTLPLARGGVRS